MTHVNRKRVKAYIVNSIHVTLTGFCTNEDFGKFLLKTFRGKRSSLPLKKSVCCAAKIEVIKYLPSSQVEQVVKTLNIV